MFKKVENFINKNKMIEPNNHIVIGVSGGADSVCLLDILCHLSKKYNLTITAVHINHMIRGKEADNDEAYVKELCQQYSVELKVLHIDIPKLARENKISLELAGRNARYEAFNSVENVDKIAVAHHGDDQTETVLFNIFRGSSLKGAGGIRPVRGKIIRPLMCVGRAEIEGYLKKHSLRFCMDSTNNETEYTRNKLRNELIPYIKENINKEASVEINLLASDLQKCYEYISGQAKMVYDDCVIRNKQFLIDVKKVSIQPDIIRQHIWIMALEEKLKSLQDITRKHIESIDDLLYKAVSKRVDLPGGLQAIRGYETIEFKMSMVDNGERCDNISEDDFHFEIMEFDGDWQKLTNDYAKVFDYDKIKGNVVLRKRLPGDYFIIDGNGRRKLLKTYLIDEKVPQDKRDNVWLLAEGSHILWIVGHRVSEAYKTTKTTKRILRVSVWRETDGI